jgi:ABC-2 type transport system ATP-binding protein
VVGARAKTIHLPLAPPIALALPALAVAPALLLHLACLLPPHGNPEAPASGSAGVAALLSTRDLRRDFGRGRRALQGVTLDVAAGETVALLGPNGAGKSTLLAILAGVLRPTSGAAWVGGVRVPPGGRALARLVGYVPQGESVYPELTVEENLRFFARLHGVRDARARAAELLREVRLESRAVDRAGALSGGLRQRLALACSLAHDPRVLLLDEPGTGLDPAARERLAQLVARFRGRDRAVLLSTHSLEEAERVADRVLFLVEGSVRDALPAAQARRLEAAFRAAEGEA